MNRVDTSGRKVAEIWPGQFLATSGTVVALEVVEFYMQRCHGLQWWWAASTSLVMNAIILLWYILSRTRLGPRDSRVLGQTAIVTQDLALADVAAREALHLAVDRPDPFVAFELGSAKSGKRGSRS